MSNEIALDVPLECLNNFEMVSSLISCFILHILYIRCLIPVPFTTMQKEMTFRINNNDKKMSMSEKKILGFIHHLDTLLTDLDSIIKYNRLSTLYLLIGPSINNVKESFVLNFDYGVCNQDMDFEYIAPTSAKLLAKFKRQLLHKLIEHQSANENLKPASQSNIFVVLKTAKLNLSPSIEEGAPEDASDPLQREEEEAAANDAIQNRFVYRDGFRLREKKRGPRPLVVSFNGLSSEQSDAQVIALSQVISDVLSIDQDLEFEYVPSTSSGVQRNIIDGDDEEEEVKMIVDEGEEEQTVDDRGESASGNDSVQEVEKSTWLVLKKGIKSIKGSSSGGAGGGGY